MNQEIKPANTETPFSAFQERLVRAAFEYVATFAPEVASVEYDEECRWCFMGSDGKPVVFPERGADGKVLDVSALEAAADAVDFPSKFSRS
ncbi:hypothetical protein [Pseudomonas sp. UMAB-40]|uniref:hypothetical protein n=1 Tax=Pseudomonas sp. UMAB-40 TaxID=1365407 RepID=UPI001C5839CE|nr:hypothetical protein [Pseudomonas sp. UMAB-40]